MDAHGRTAKHTQQCTKAGRAISHGAWEWGVHFHVLTRTHGFWRLGSRRKTRRMGLEWG
jgi:hypothetical protein